MNWRLRGVLHLRFCSRPLRRRQVLEKEMDEGEKGE